MRHYAEVHLLMEPGEPNSGIQTETLCSEDKLDKNWQRLIITHITEKAHLGVLTGSPITDIKITLVNGRAHQKHTEGGDFLPGHVSCNTQRTYAGGKRFIGTLV